MAFAGYYLDGEWAERRAVEARLAGSAANGTWEIIDTDTGETLTRWPADELVRKPARAGQLRLSARTAPLGARLVLTGAPLIAEAEAAMPALGRQRRRHRTVQGLQLAASTLVLAGVVGAYIWGIPLAARPLTALMPAEWEADLGRSVAGQFEEAFGENGRLAVCDSDPESPANKAIARFVDRVLGDSTPPFPVSVTVGHSEVPNAFAIPGGQVYYLSALLDETETAEEFAGVLAHEIGHVMHRHAMQNVVSAAGTGLVIGFILGDMTGVSLAAIIGSVIIESRHSREAEREADLFAAEAGTRLGFAPNAFPDLLDRISSEDSNDAMLALLSSHPLTMERRQYLDQIAAGGDVAGQAFLPEEWEAISTMCDNGGDGQLRKFSERR